MRSYQSVLILETAYVKCLGLEFARTCTNTGAQSTLANSKYFESVLEKT